MIMNAKIKLLQYVIFSKPQNFDTVNIKCFSISVANLLYLFSYRMRFFSSKTFLFSGIVLIGYRMKDCPMFDSHSGGRPKRK